MARQYGRPVGRKCASGRQLFVARENLTADEWSARWLGAPPFAGTHYGRCTSATTSGGLSGIDRHGQVSHDVGHSMTRTAPSFGRVSRRT